MTNPISTVIPEVAIHNNRAITTSVAVADYFQKSHDNVLKKIRAVMLDCDPSWRLVNFNETSYTRENPNGGAGIATAMYELSRDAFVLIVMGFTGKKALQWKIDYINAFNKMEAELHNQVAQPAPTIYPLSGKVLFEYKNGELIRAHVLRPDEFLMTMEGHTEILQRNGYVVIHNQNLKSLTVEEILRLGEAARLASNRWRMEMVKP